jgi:hypothetical protein
MTVKKSTKPLVNYYDTDDGHIARVEKYIYQQHGKKVFFELPPFPDGPRKVEVFHFGKKLLNEWDYHFHWNRMFLHFHLPYKDIVQVVVTRYQHGEEVVDEDAGDSCGPSVVLPEPS